MDIGPNSSTAFAIVEAPYFFSNSTFSHEFGHLLGCHHNWPYDLGTDNDNTTCAHGYRWLDIPSNATYNDPDIIYHVKSWRTLMGVPVSSNYVYEITRSLGTLYIQIDAGNDYPILNYSNPDVYYDGQPTGRSDGYIANNALYIRYNACEVANFFPTQELGLSIVAPRPPNDCKLPFSLSADITQPGTGIPGIPPYTVKWYWNYSGIFTGYLPPNSYLGQGPTIYLNQFPATVFWIRCEVTSADNIVVSRIMKFDKTPCGGFAPNGSEDREEMFVGNSKVKVFPNPATGSSLHLNLSDEYANIQTEVKVSDLYGRCVQLQKVTFDAEGNGSMDIHGISSGIYYLSCKSATGDIKNVPFVIVKN
jgi:hypothetical protein